MDRTLSQIISYWAPILQDTIHKLTNPDHHTAQNTVYTKHILNRIKHYTENAILELNSLQEKGE